MKFSYKFSSLLGSVYRRGNLVFTADGNVVISPVGNRITLFDLKSNKAETLCVESRFNFTAVALSSKGSMLVAVNEVGELFLVSLISRTVLHRHQFQKPVKDIKFSPNGRYIAFTKENVVMVYQAPGQHRKEYNPFKMQCVLRGFYEDTTCLDWTSDSSVLAVGGKDMSTRIYGVKKFKNLHVYTLGSHSDRVVGCFFEENSLDICTVARNCAVCVWEASTDLADLIPQSSSKSKDDQDEEASTVESGEPEKPAEKQEMVYYKRMGRYHVREAAKGNHTLLLLSAAYNRKTKILVTGFSNGAFLLHELPEFTLIQSLTLENNPVSAVCFNGPGDWLAIGSSKQGQLVVWEWQSESFVMKQQGHFNNLTCVAYSPDGQHLATGGDDGKVKVWNTSTGFCFVTFSEHKSGVSGITFMQSGKAVISSSLDGTVRAFDLQRYRNFRTFTSPRPTQFSCLSVDSSGEIVCAGSQDSFEIFVWSVQTGKLLEILAGHEAPVCSISFSPHEAVLASVSWDKTLRVWDVFENKGSRETIQLPADGLAVAFRQDGTEVAVATLDGQITFFDVHNAVQTGSIEGRNDLSVGLKDTDMVTAKKLLKGQAFTTLCYSAGGDYILAGGKSKNVCIYHVKEEILVKKFEITCNHSFDAMDEFLNRRKMTEFGNIALIEKREDEDSVSINLPGAKRGEMASRSFKPEVRVTSVQFSTTGRAWACTTTEGLLIYSLDHNLVFDPFDLDSDITSTSIRTTLQDNKHSEAIIMALKLNEQSLITEILERILPEYVQVVSQGLPQFYVEKLLTFLGSHLEKSPHMEYYLTWIQSLLLYHGNNLKRRSSSIQHILRTLQKSLMLKAEDLGKICDHNKYSLQYILSLGDTRKRKAEHIESQVDSPMDAEDPDCEISFNLC